MMGPVTIWSVIRGFPDDDTSANDIVVNGLTCFAGLRLTNVETYVKDKRAGLLR